MYYLLHCCFNMLVCITRAVLVCEASQMFLCLGRMSLQLWVISDLSDTSAGANQIVLLIISLLHRCINLEMCCPSYSRGHSMSLENQWIRPSLTFYWWQLQCTLPIGIHRLIFIFISYSYYNFSMCACMCLYVASLTTLSYGQLVSIDINASFQCRHQWT